MLCSSCGSPDVIRITENEYLCDHCGTRLFQTDKHSSLRISGVRCPKCGFNNKPEDHFCEKCGTNLCKYCTSCGAETPIDRKFCATCGKRDFSEHELQSVILRPGSWKAYDKFEVIKALRVMYGVGVFEAKQVAERDSVIASGVLNEEALALKERFEAFGATVEIRVGILPLDSYLKQ
jgi:ribosomal protein L7/L12